MNRSPRNLLLVPALFALGLSALAGCSAGETPTPTAVSPPAATAPVEPPTAAPTDTVAPTEGPTGTPAPPEATEAASTPTAAIPIPDLAWRQVGLSGNNVQQLSSNETGAGPIVASLQTGTWQSHYDFTAWETLKASAGGHVTGAAVGSADVLYVTSNTGCASGGPISLARSTDGGKTWQEKTDDSLPINVIAGPGTNAYGATCSGLVKTSDAGATWAEVPGTHVENYDPKPLAYGPDGESLYAAYYSEGGTTRIFRLLEKSGKFEEITPKAPNGDLRGPALFATVPVKQGQPGVGALFLVTSPGVLWSLPEEATDWKLLTTTDPRMDRPQADFEITAITADPATGALYTARASNNAGTMQGLGVFRSIDMGQSWEQMGKGLDTRVVNTLLVAPPDPALPGAVPVLLAGASDGVWAVQLPSR